MVAERSGGGGERRSKKIDCLGADGQIRKVNAISQKGIDYIEVKKSET